ncbi:hypothetical protein J6590_068999 [Homalodisca vitripennis]|nr:hypothetical protein J6590_068999 [Homalodisca vitripennis]
MARYDDLISYVHEPCNCFGFYDILPSLTPVWARWLSCTSDLKRPRSIFLSVLCDGTPGGLPFQDTLVVSHADFDESIAFTRESGLIRCWTADSQALCNKSKQDHTKNMCFLPSLTPGQDGDSEESSYLGTIKSERAFMVQSHLVEFKVFLISSVITRQYFFVPPFNLVLAIASLAELTTRSIASKSNLVQMDRMGDSTTSMSSMRGSKYVRKRSSIKFKTKSKQSRTLSKPIRQILKSVKNTVDVHKNAINNSYQRLPSSDEEGADWDGGPVTSHDVADPDDNSLDGDLSRLHSEGRPILPTDNEAKPVGFFGALKIPGVVEFSLCLFFAKLVSYTFLYWLPQYIKTSTSLGPAESADLSTVFDVGGIVGGIAAGIISDYSGKSASTCAVMLVVAVPVLQIYNLYGAHSLALNFGLLLVAGLLVNGPYALITTAVSAELGTHHSLQGNSKALATVTAIIDGTGSIGAAVGPLLAGVVSQWGWNKVFYMLMASDVLALVVSSQGTEC